MKPEFEKVLKDGEIVFVQEFGTTRGCYSIHIYRFMECVYYFKYRNRKIVECNNLSKMKARVK